MAGAVGALRDRAVNGFFGRFSAAGLPQLNQARNECGLEPLRAWEDQLRSVAGIYVLTAPELDFAGSLALPANVHYVGPAFEHTGGHWTSPWPAENPDPLILLSFSTSYMQQDALVQRVLDAGGDSRRGSCSRPVPPLTQRTFAFLRTPGWRRSCHTGPSYPRSTSW